MSKLTFAQRFPDASMRTPQLNPSLPLLPTIPVQFCAIVRTTQHQWVEGDITHLLDRPEGLLVRGEL